MKNATGLLAILFLLYLSACQKEAAPKGIKENLIGEWNWLENIGGMTGQEQHSPEKDGYTLSYHFYENDSIYIVKDGNEIQQKTVFHITKEKSILFHEEHDFLTIDFKFKEQGPDSIIVLPMRYIIDDLNESELRLTEDVYDGYGWQFMRKE